MECEKCKSINLIVLKAEDTLTIDEYTYEQYEETIIYFQCNDCKYEFTELV